MPEVKNNAAGVFLRVLQSVNTRIAISGKETNGRYNIIAMFSNSEDGHRHILIPMQEAPLV